MIAPLELLVAPGGGNAPRMRSLVDAFNIARDPPAVEVLRGRLGAFAVDITLPGTRKEGQIALDGLKIFWRLVERPDAVAHRVSRVDGAHHGVVGYGTSELVKGGTRSRRERKSDAGGWDEVSYTQQKGQG